MPSLERVRFVSSGTEAAMSAVRVARAATGRDRILKFEGCYHGHADRVSGEGRLRRADARHADQPRRHARRRRPTRWSPPTTISTRSSASFDAQPRSDRRGHRRADRRQHGRRAAGATASCAGCARSATAHGALLIFDEVISGFRAAAGGAQALAGVRPDLTCLGKIIGGGLPVGAYGGRADLMELVSPAGPGLSGGHAVGQSARDDGRAVVPRSSCRRSCTSRWRRSARGSPPDWPTPRATPASRCRSTRSARC